MSTTTAQTGECRECGRRFRLKADDTIRHHSDKRQATGLPFSPRCDGADKYPKPGTVREEQ